METSTVISGFTHHRPVSLEFCEAGFALSFILTVWEGSIRKCEGTNHRAIFYFVISYFFYFSSRTLAAHLLWKLLFLSFARDVHAFFTYVRTLLHLPCHWHAIMFPWHVALKGSMFPWLLSPDWNSKCREMIRNKHAHWGLNNYATYLRYWRMHFSSFAYQLSVKPLVSNPSVIVSAKHCDTLQHATPV